MADLLTQWLQADVGLKVPLTNLEQVSCGRLS